MIEIIESGPVGTEDHLLRLTCRCGQIIVPEDGDLDLTHWWLLRDEGVEALYVGTGATFEVFVRERNGGLQ